ncbi:methyltransferase [Arsukibacterium sp. MJ3]|uniref:tRNA/rRNA methyltransferase n=1 Tax=Arsukibacterium sp. MJ3 TaxID=1632859 RepID=UPI0006273815|nr:tRNA/rRNA methyltransferase [Arsukibacterium sp. MJ3]KKO49344.1 methyltransferase [Arsukibacterium sp. MJ3]
MSQQRPKGGKAANPLHKPWVKTDKSAASKPNRNAAGTKRQVAKPVKAVLNNESKVYGENACRVLFNQRPESVIRLYISSTLAPKFADVMKYLASEKKAYHIVDDAELEKVAASQHHGGIVLLVKRQPIASIANYLTTHNAKQDCLLALDGVGNPHNLGAIARTCAHFGVTGIIMREPQLLQSGAALRTAEGGGEYISPLSCDDMPLALKLCKDAGYSLVTTSSHGGQSLYKTALPQKVVIVFGEEMFGVSKVVANSADIALQIPGTGKVESLNVSVAASLIVGEWYRQQQHSL